MTDSLLPIDTSLFDTAADPSVDFFRYVNGRWLDANPVPADYGSWGAFNEVNERNQQLLHRLLEDAAGAAGPPGTARRMVGDYYAAAMDEAAIAAAGATPLDELLARVSAASSLSDVRDVARDLQRAGVGVFHSLGVEADFENSDAYLVYVGQGGLGLPERDYYTRDDDRSVRLREDYLRHVAAQLRNLGDAEDQAQDAAQAILALESRLADASYTAAQMRDVTLTMNRHEVRSLDELMPRFGLRSYLRELGATAPTVNIDNAEFFRVLDAALAETPLPTLQDYLRWHLVRSYAGALSPAFEREAFDFYGRTLGGQREMRPRWKRVLEAASRDIGEQVARLYVEAAFSEDAKRRCEEMVRLLLSAMRRAIRDADWMGDATRAEALKKLDGFGYKIGYPDEWRDYSGLEIERTSYASNRLRAALFEHDREMGRLGKPVDKSEWAMPAHVVNAYYHPLLNEIVFPAGILQPPFFYAGADDAVNYGAIGAVIGHEITHGFDDQGSRFDAGGALRDWWTPEDRAEFDRRAEQLVEQFGGYEVLDGLRVNGRLTLGENIADLGGLSIAYGALLETLGDDPPSIDGLTPQQRFFFSWAAVWRTNYTEEYSRLLVNVDPHSPARFRANGPLTNFPPFARAFDISAGTPMACRAEHQAHIW